MMITGPEGGPYWRELRKFAVEATSAALEEDLYCLDAIRRKAKTERRMLIERFGCPVQMVIL